MDSCLQNDRQGQLCLVFVRSEQRVPRHIFCGQVKMHITPELLKACDDVDRWVMDGLSPSEALLSLGIGPNTGQERARCGWGKFDKVETDWITPPTWDDVRKYATAIYRGTS